MDGLQSKCCSHGNAVSTGYTQLYVITGTLSHEFFNKIIRPRSVVKPLNHCRSAADGRTLRPLGYIMSQTSALRPAKSHCQEEQQLIARMLQAFFVHTACTILTNGNPEFKTITIETPLTARNTKCACFSKCGTHWLKGHGNSSVLGFWRSSFLLSGCSLDSNRKR